MIAGFVKVVLYVQHVYIASIVLHVSFVVNVTNAIIAKNAMNVKVVQVVNIARKATQ
jgi:hypothetical protein